MNVFDCECVRASVKMEHYSRITLEMNNQAIYFDEGEKKEREKKTNVHKGSSFTQIDWAVARNKNFIRCVHLIFFSFFCSHCVYIPTYTYILHIHKNAGFIYLPI